LRVLGVWGFLTVWGCGAVVATWWWCGWFFCPERPVVLWQHVRQGNHSSARCARVYVSAAGRRLSR
jgi:hypothetical protein